MALWLEKWSRYCLDCTSSGAFTRHAAIPPFILITALGTTAYVFVAHWLQHKPKTLLIVVAALVKAGVLFGGYSLFFLFQFPPKIVNIYVVCV